jgi:threonine dehydrogenase-like Zn-dependent dehydrogenase
LPRCWPRNAVWRCTCSTASRRAPKPDLVRDLGATYHTSDIATIAAHAPPDVTIEATGVPQLVLDAVDNTAAAGIVCLTGVSPVGRNLSIDAGALGREIVLENDVVFGSVNANLGHYRLAAKALAEADARWLERLITRRVPLVGSRRRWIPGRTT